MTEQEFAEYIYSVYLTGRLFKNKAFEQDNFLVDYVDWLMTEII